MRRVVSPVQGSAQISIAETPALRHDNFIMFDADGSGFFVDLKQISRRDDVSSSGEQGQDIVHAGE